MKKVFFAVALVASMAFVACNNTNETNVNNDTIDTTVVDGEVDTTMVDTMIVEECE